MCHLEKVIHIYEINNLDKKGAKMNLHFFIDYRAFKSFGCGPLRQSKLIDSFRSFIRSKLEIKFF